MFCLQCGKEIPAGTQVCANCGSTMPGSAPVTVQQNNDGCFKGCLIAFLLLIGVIVGLIVVGVGRKMSEDTVAVAQHSITTEDGLKNGENLIAWAKAKEEQTDLLRNDAFARLKGKTVILKGTVREVGETMFGKDYFVSLTVGKLSAFERLNIQFNMRESQYEKFKAWNVGEVHTLRGRIAGQGDLEDDAMCDLGEIVE